MSAWATNPQAVQIDALIERAGRLTLVECDRLVVAWVAAGAWENAVRAGDAARVRARALGWARPWKLFRAADRIAARGAARVRFADWFAASYAAPFSFTDVARLIRFFTKSGQTVLDPFVGIGSTLKAAALEGRGGVGIELSPTFAELSRERLDKELTASLFPSPEQRVIEGDARHVLTTLDTDSVDFVVTSPPYWQILHKKDHKVKQEREAKGLATRYSEDDPRDLGNIESYETFLKELTGIFAECGRVLRPKQYLAAIVGDFRDGGRYRMFHADLAAQLEEQTPFVVKGVTILYQTHKRVFPYGYPAAFVPNLHHQYIVILRNEK